MLISLAVNCTDPTGQIVEIMVLGCGYCLAGLQQTIHIIHKFASCILILSLFVVISITAGDIPIYAVFIANPRWIVDECRCIKEQETIIGANTIPQKIIIACVNGTLSII